MLFVCFFKQKTAYEMRISDWSSDLCSSDLDRGDVGPRTGRDDPDAHQSASCRMGPRGTSAPCGIERGRPARALQLDAPQAARRAVMTPRAVPRCHLADRKSVG